jgi:hypothetical protein
MSTQRRVPYLSRLNNEGTREKPCILYVTKGGKDDSMIFHMKEENNYYQYRRLNVYKTKVTLMCIYKRNKRGKCKAELTIVPKRDNLIITKFDEKNKRSRFFLNYEESLKEDLYTDCKLSNQMVSFIPNTAKNKSHFI